jgi:uncharacterized membrane protein
MQRTYPTEATAQPSAAAEIHSQAAIARHPIHPMLVPFPIGFLVGMLVADLVFVRTQDIFWATGAYWLGVAGLITGGAAAIFGAIDFFSKPQIRRLSVAWVHLLGNLAVMAVTLINVLIRVNNRLDTIQPTGLALSVLVVVLMIITGWCGGEMVFRYRVGVDTTGQVIPSALPSEPFEDTSPTVKIKE